MNVNFKEAESLLSDVDSLLNLIKVNYKSVCEKLEKAKNRADYEEYSDFICLKFEYEGLLNAITDYNLDNVTERFIRIIDKEAQKNEK